MATQEDAGQAFITGRNPGNLTQAEIYAEFAAHLIPGAYLVPGAIAEVVLLQEKGYRLIVEG